MLHLYRDLFWEAELFYQGPTYLLYPNRLQHGLMENQFEFVDNKPSWDSFSSNWQDFKTNTSYTHKTSNSINNWLWQLGFLMKITRKPIFFVLVTNLNQSHSLSSLMANSTISSLFFKILPLYQQVTKFLKTQWISINSLFFSRSTHVLNNQMTLTLTP